MMNGLGCRATRATNDVAPIADATQDEGLLLLDGVVVALDGVDVRFRRRLGEHPFQHGDQVEDGHAVARFDRVAQLGAHVRRGPAYELLGALLEAPFEMARRLFVAHVFEQAPHELGARIDRLALVVELGPGQQHLRFDPDQDRGHVDEVGDAVEVDLFEHAHVGEVLVSDAGDGDVVDVQLIAADEEQEQVERPLEVLKLDAVHDEWACGRVGVRV